MSMSNDSPPDSLLWQGRVYHYIGTQVNGGFTQYLYGAFSHEPLAGVTVHVFIFDKPMACIPKRLFKTNAIKLAYYRNWYQANKHRLEWYRDADGKRRRRIKAVQHETD